MKKKGEKIDPVIERLEEYLIKRNEKLSNLAIAIGISRSYFAVAKFNGNYTSSFILSKVINYFPDLSAEWLLTGQGKMLRDATTKDVLTYSQKIKNKKTVQAEISDIKERLEKIENLLSKI